jgi:hypothetical protein
MKQANTMLIVRVANGFMIEMPRPMPDAWKEPMDTRNEIAEGMKSAMPILKEIIRMQHSDPLLEEIMGRNEDDTPAVPDPPEVKEVMSVDLYTHVFPDWAGVIAFLSNLVL